MSSRGLTSARLWLAVLVVLLRTMCASAQQSADTVTAEALFEEGKSLLASQRFSEACPKLAESERLDPATGTLLALAMCHEGNGQLASAWAEFSDAESRARRDEREDRQKFAHDHAAALRPRLSTLEIQVGPAAAAIDGLSVKRGGEELGRGVWNSAVPIDGGTYAIEASAPGRVAFKSETTLQPEGDRAVVVIPELEPVPAVAPAVGPPTVEQAPAAKSTVSPPAEHHGLSTLQWAGIATAGAGVAALAVGGYFLGTALSERNDSNRPGDTDYCGATYCGPIGLEKRKDAVKHGNFATGFGIAGGALLAGGATLYLVGGGSSSTTGRAHSTLTLTASAGPTAIDAGVGGRF